MSNQPLSKELVALMEIHCREYRVLYGHLRNDGLGHLEPIPFPSRQMPTFFQLQVASDKNLKLWMQIEKTLFDHYEVPMHFRTYMGIGARQEGKATRGAEVNRLLDLVMPLHVNPKVGRFADLEPKRDVDERGYPIRADLTPDWGYTRKPHQRDYRPVGVGGHVDDIVVLGARPFRIGDYLTPIYRMWDRIHEVMDEEYRKPKHSTDYPKRKGWLQIPDQQPCEAKPSPRLLSLISRAQR